MAVTEKRYAFEAEWLDTTASLTRRFTLMYYPDAGAVELYDIKNKKTFLKRSPYELVRLSDLLIGSQVTVYSRQLTIVDYADDFTKRALTSTRERTLALIKPDAYQSMGKIVDEIYSAGFTVARMRLVMLRTEEGRRFYADHVGKSFYEELVQSITSDAVLALELVGESAIDKWRTLMGSLRSEYGRDSMANAVHGSNDKYAAAREIDFFFGSSSFLSSPAVLDHCSLLIIKPHAVLGGLAGQIMESVLSEGLEVSALEMFALDKLNAEEFLEVYKGIVADYQSMIDELVSGPCIAIEVRGENVVANLRELCGPLDPELGRRIRPHSIRARFGVNKVRNAVHCTDLVEDGPLESEYFFRILQ